MFESIQVHTLIPHMHMSDIDSWNEKKINNRNDNKIIAPLEMFYWNVDIIHQSYIRLHFF